MEVVRSSDAMTHVPSAQLRSKLQHEVLASDTDCRALLYSRTPQHMGAQGLPAVVPRWPVQWGSPYLQSGRMKGGMQCQPHASLPITLRALLCGR